MAARRPTAAPRPPPPGPPLPAMFARYQDRVAGELAAAAAAAADSPFAIPVRYHLGWADQDGNPAASPAAQGKALRPTLCMFACEALAGNLAAAAAAAAALELIHNFSLIHDDIQDGDLERRHQPTVWALWGQPKALVCGDAVQSLGDAAMLRVADRGASPATALQVSRLLLESYLEMIEGQCRDLEFEARADIATADYLQMIAGKTGALIRSSLEIGATLAASGPAAAPAFANFGRYLGRAFQIRDDYLGVWGNAAATGKSTDNDIRRRKKSLPAVYALEQATGAAGRDLRRLYAQPELSDADVQRVLAIMDAVGAAPYAQRLAAESAAQAVRALDPLTLPPWAQAEVAELVDFLAHRQF